MEEMMKFEVLQEQLVRGLMMVSRSVANRPQLPVLANILLEAKKDGLVMSATDLELSMRTRVGAKVEKEGKVSVPARMMVDFVQALSPGKVKCELVKESLVLSSGGFRGKIQTIAADEFPSMPNLKVGAMGQVAMEDWREGVGAVQFAAAKDALRPVLTGVLLSWGKKKMKMVATDGFRLSVREVGVSGEGWGKPLLVPSRAVGEVSKLEEGETLEVVVYEETSQVAFRVGESVVVSQLLSGNYPEYGKIIPGEFEGGVTVVREELLSALRAVHIFARDNSNVTRWKVEGEGIELSAETPEKGEAKAAVVGEVDGEGGEIVFNAKFVLDYLVASSAEKVKLLTSGSLAPGVFQEEGKSGWTYVVMPINA